MVRIRHFVPALLVAVIALIGCTAIKPVLKTNGAPLGQGVFSNTSFDNDQKNTKLPQTTR